MKLNNLGFTPCGIKNISRCLLLSFTFSVLFEAVPLRAQSASVNKTLTTAAQAQRTAMINNLSKSLNSTLKAKWPTLSKAPTSLQALSAAVATGNLQPLGQSVTLPGSTIPTTFNLVGKALSGYSYVGLYNAFFKLAQYDQQALTDAPNYSLLGGLFYFGDGSASGSISAYGEPGNKTTFPTTQPFASFLQPSATYNYPITTGNFELSGGILKKTAQFCNALDTAYGTTGVAGSGWLGATCVTTNDCCQNAVGQKAGVGASGGATPVSGSIECRQPVAQAPAALDPQGTGAMISYGICDLKQAPPPPGNNCGATPQAKCGTAPTANCCANGLTAVPGILSGCSCLIPLGNTGVAAGIQCKSSSDCASTGSGILAVSNVCNTKTGICVAPPTNAGFGQSCAVPPTLTQIDPKGVATTCVTGKHLGCDYQPVTIEGVTYSATNQCKGKSGYECGMISDCLAGYECNANDSGTQVCESTCTVGSAAVTTVTSGSSCKSNTGPCCTTSGFTCDASQTVASQDVCCINPRVGDGGNAYAFTASDCCNGFVLGNALIAGTSLGTANFCSITREIGCAKDSDCPAVEYAPNGGTQTCLMAKSYYYCQEKDPVSAVSDALSAAGFDSLIVGSALGGLTTLYLLYKAGKVIAVKVKGGMETVKSVAREVNIVANAAVKDVGSAVEAVGGDPKIAGLVQKSSAEALGGQSVRLDHSPSGVEKVSVGGAGQPEVPANVETAAGGGGGGGGGNPLVGDADAQMLIVAMTAIPDPPPGSAGWSLNISDALGRGEASDLLVADTGHDVAKAYALRRIINPAESVGESLKNILGAKINKDYQAELSTGGSATPKQIKDIAIAVLRSVVLADSGAEISNDFMNKLDAGRKAFILALAGVTSITSEDAKSVLAGLAENFSDILDANGNKIFSVDYLDPDDSTYVPATIDPSTFLGPE